MPLTAVFDVGVTQAKLVLVDQAGNVCHRQTVDNKPLSAPPYLHVDTERLWRWLIGALSVAAGVGKIHAIVPCAHGSCAALLGGDDPNTPLALPVLHYEAQPPQPVADAYARIAPPFAEVLAPVNPGGLTLGRQLFWQQTLWPDQFAGVSRILCYPQYWAWRLSGEASNEVTSLGAQTQLWAPRAGGYSSLVASQGWRPLFAPLRQAWEVLGPLRPELARRTGLGPATPVLCGIHDSNANYLRYQSADLGAFSLMSTGTWIINFDAGFRPADLHASLDTNTNSDVFGTPVSCSRFMGGREYQLLGGGDLPAHTVMPALQRVIAGGIFALPSFTDSGGPWPGSGGRGRIVTATGAPANPTGAEAGALATLYCALMANQALSHIGTTSRILIDGAFARNRPFCAIIAALNSTRPVAVARQADGTALGAALLARIPGKPPSNAALELEQIEPLSDPTLQAYSRDWRVLSRGQCR